MDNDTPDLQNLHPSTVEKDPTADNRIDLGGTDPSAASFLFYMGFGLVMLYFAKDLFAPDRDMWDWFNLVFGLICVLFGITSLIETRLTADAETRTIHVYQEFATYPMEEEVYSYDDVVFLVTTHSVTVGHNYSGPENSDHFVKEGRGSFYIQLQLAKRTIALELGKHDQKGDADARVKELKEILELDDDQIIFKLDFTRMSKQTDESDDGGSGGE